MEFVATVSAEGAHTSPGERALEREELFCRGEESSQSFPSERPVSAHSGQWPVLSCRSLLFMCRKGGVSSFPVMMSQLMMGICHKLMPAVRFRSFI